MGTRVIKGKGMIVRMLNIVIVAFLLFTFSGCSNTKKEQTDILSQKKTEEGRTQITVLVKYAFSINKFEEMVEEKFPDIDLVQVGNYTADMGIAEYESRLEHGDLTDIVMTWPLDVGEEYWEDRLIDMSGMEFAGRYNISMLNNISKDGKLFYLPGPAQIRGIIYNKTLFKENGWKVPFSYEEFISLCQTIEATGIRALQLGFENEEVLDTAFIGYNYSQFFSTPADVQWLEKYNQGEGDFEEQFSQALDNFEEMIEAGIFKPEDLEISYSEREKMLFNRQCAMVEDSVLMARMGYAQTGTTDEYALMPFWNKGTDGDWARLYMVCYIGLNKELEQSQNSEKYEKVLKLMDYISTEEGQKYLAADTGAMLSSLQNVKTPTLTEIEYLAPAINAGRYGVFPEFKRSKNAFREGLAGMVKGELTADQVIEMINKENQQGTEKEAIAILGTAKEKFSLLETGNFIADSLRNYSNCEIALFLDNGKDGRYNGKGVSGSLYEGDITDVDLQRILPDLKHGESGTLWNITMTGENLIKTLEYSIPVDNNLSGWFYYFSGLKMEYNPQNDPGSRIITVTTSDNQEIQMDKLYTVGVMDETVPEEFIESKEETGVTIQKILQETIQQQNVVEPSKDGRFIISE